LLQRKKNTFDCIKKKTREWVKQWLQKERKRDTLSHISLIAELPISCEVDLKNYLQMTDGCFKILPHLLKVYVERQNTRMRRAISAEERLTAYYDFWQRGEALKI
jgi:hypothetical protein